MDVILIVVGIAVVAGVLYMFSKSSSKKDDERREVARTRVRAARQRLRGVRTSGRTLSATRREQLERFERGFDTNIDLINILVLEALLDEFDACANECGENGWYEDDDVADDAVMIEEAVEVTELVDAAADDEVVIDEPASSGVDTPTFDAVQGDEQLSIDVEPPSRTPVYEPPPPAAYEPSGDSGSGGGYDSGGGDSGSFD